MVMLWRNALHAVQVYLCLKAQSDVNIVGELCVQIAEAQQPRIIDAPHVETLLADEELSI
jgi:sulfur relay (sulfurtransferase) DsrF/TusC family protein